MIPLLFALFFAPQEKPPEKATLSGTVVNSLTREPLARAMVLAETAGGGPAASTISDAAGKFELVGLEPGQYHIKGRRNGYLKTYFGAKRATSKGSAVSLDPGQQFKDLEIKLLPYAVIAGTVRDTDGEPIAGANVAIVSLEYSEGRRMYSNESLKETDDLGQYRVIVPPGRYYVRAEPAQEDESHEPIDHSPSTAKPRERLLPMFFPGVADAALTRPLEVGPGARLTGIDIPLARSRVFRVKVHVDAPQGLAPSVGLEPKSEGQPGVHLKPQTLGNGDFEFRNVPPGSYLLKAAAALPALPTSNPFEAMFGADRSYRARMPVEVTSADVDGVRITIAPGAEIVAHVTVEGEEPKLPRQFTVLRFMNADGSSDFWAREGGTFHAVRSPGRYDVYLLNDGGLVTKSIRTESTDVMADGLTVTGPGKVALEIVVTSEAGQLDGTVVDTDDKPVPGATVVMVPAPRLRHRWDLFRSTTADQYGRYEIKDALPGEYQVLAWDDVEPDAWLDPDFLKDLEKQAAAVKIQSKGRETMKLTTVAR